MLNAMRCALSHYRELILAGTFAVMATWEVLEIVPRRSGVLIRRAS
jgi:hypothetical protein